MNKKSSGRVRVSKESIDSLSLAELREAIRVIQKLPKPTNSTPSVKGNKPELKSILLSLLDNEADKSSSSSSSSPPKKSTRKQVVVEEESSSSSESADSTPPSPQSSRSSSPIPSPPSDSTPSSASDSSYKQIKNKVEEMFQKQEEERKESDRKQMEEERERLHQEKLEQQHEQEEREQEELKIRQQQHQSTKKRSLSYDGDQQQPRQPNKKVSSSSTTTPSKKEFKDYQMDEENEYMNESTGSRHHFDADQVEDDSDTEELSKEISLLQERLKYKKLEKELINKNKKINLLDKKIDEQYQLQLQLEQTITDSKFEIQSLKSLINEQDDRIRLFEVNKHSRIKKQDKIINDLKEKLQKYEPTTNGTTSSVSSSSTTTTSTSSTTNTPNGKANQNDFIIITFNSCWGDVLFRVKKTTLFSKVVNRFLEEKCISESKVRFHHNNNPMDLTQTPNDLNLTGEMIIEVSSK